MTNGASYTTHISQVSQCADILGLPTLPSGNFTLAATWTALIRENITPHMHRILLLALQFNVLAPLQDIPSSSDVAKPKESIKVRFSAAAPMKERDERTSCDSRSYDNGGLPAPSTSSTTDHCVPDGCESAQSSGDAPEPCIGMTSKDRSVLARSSAALRRLSQLPLGDMARARMSSSRNSRGKTHRSSGRHSQLPPRKPFPCVARCFKVTRRHRDPIMDNISKVAFPTGFVIFNVIYWCFYSR